MSLDDDEDWAAYRDGQDRANEEWQHALVYVVTMAAVYDHGCAGVFTTREAAESHAQALLDDSDWHHGFCIKEMPLNRGLRTEPLRISWRDPDWKARKSPQATEFEAWVEPNAPYQPTAGDAEI